MFLYKALFLWAGRKPSLFPPRQQEVVVSGFYLDEMTRHIQRIWEPRFATWFLTKELMLIFMRYWFMLYKSTLGYNSATALLAAKVNMANFISTSAVAVAVPLLSMWAGLIGLHLFFGFLDWLDGVGGGVDFGVGTYIMREGHQLWWAGLIATPYKNCGDYQKCVEIPEVPFQDSRHHMRFNVFVDYWYFSGMWVESQSAILFHHVFVYKTFMVKPIGPLENLGWGRYRFKGYSRDPYLPDVPVGWGIREYAACEWVGRIHDHFTYYKSPQPPVEIVL